MTADALAIWDAAVAAVEPSKLVEEAVRAFSPETAQAIAEAPRVIVVGAGKAGARMAEGLERVWDDSSEGLRPPLGETRYTRAGGVSPPRISGLINVPEGSASNLQSIRLNRARPIASNHPTAAGVAGADAMLQLLADCGPNDVAICLISGGGSALLPAPAAGITLADKQAVNQLFHASGATIGEMNAVRKHLSRVKGGRLAEAFRGRQLISLIISDVVGDPLDVIASGPTAADPTTFADAMTVLARYGLIATVPSSILQHLRRGVAGEIAETPKVLPDNVANIVVGSNAIALIAARREAERRGYRILNLGPAVEGETRIVAESIAGKLRSGQDWNPIPREQPICILLGGETTVTLGDCPGKGGRNQEFVLALLHALGRDGMADVVVLSGGTDGEDGPTDAAGAVATQETIDRAAALNLNIAEHLDRHDAYPFFAATGGLIRTGLTGTNVMDIRVVLVR